MSSKTNTPNSQPNLIDIDTHYEVVPRRRSERRSANQPEGIKSKFAVEDKDLEVQKLDKKHAELFRENERRQSDRRTSRPSILSVDEIAILRKK